MAHQPTHVGPLSLPPPSSSSGPRPGPSARHLSHLGHEPAQAAHTCPLGHHRAASFCRPSLSHCQWGPYVSIVPHVQPEPMCATRNQVDRRTNPSKSEMRSSRRLPIQICVAPATNRCLIPSHRAFKCRDPLEINPAIAAFLGVRVMESWSPPPIYSTRARLGLVSPPSLLPVVNFVESPKTLALPSLPLMLLG